MGTKTDFTPTAEQVTAVDLARTGGSVAIEALAGAGKTSTLKLIAEDLGTTGAYVAFNRKIVDDGKRSFGSNVNCSTAHALAMRAKGRKFRHRLDSNRMTNRQLADRLGLDHDTPAVFGDGDDTHELSATEIAGLAHRTVETFCRTADQAPTRWHVPKVRALEDANHELKEIVLPLAKIIWDDVQKVNGIFRFTHNHYLKMWQLDDPKIDADFILFDEAQDANPLMMAIVEAQDCQKIWVGDSQQMIYEWNGAVNAMELADVGARCSLTESFRFGPEIADQANVILDRLDSGMTVVGSGPPGIVDIVAQPDVLLGRTNAEVITMALDQMAQGRRVCIQGGTKEIIYFAESALKLMAGQKVSHPDLACFKNWGEVEKYANSDDGTDLRLLVQLINQFGPQEIMIGLGAAVSEAAADATCSTAHKSKGAEWDLVQLLADFPAGEDVAPADLRLMYVAATRAKKGLDRSRVDFEGKF